MAVSMRYPKQLQQDAWIAARAKMNGLSEFHGVSSMQIATTSAKVEAYAVRYRWTRML